MEEKENKPHEHNSLRNKCWYCGGELVWNNDFDLFDVYPELEDYYEGGIVTYLTCSNCEASVEYTQKDLKEDKKDE